MKSAWLACLLPLALAIPSPASSNDVHFHCPAISSSDDHEPMRWAERRDTRDAEIAITSDNGETVMLLTRDVLGVQLSDRVMKKITHKLHESEDGDDDGALGNAIKTAVLAGVHSLLNHSLECPIEDIARVEDRNGRLVIVSENGDRMFENTQVDDENVLSSFSERDVRAFVHEFNQLKKRHRS